MASKEEERLRGMETWSIAITFAGDQPTLSSEDEDVHERVSDLMDFLSDHSPAVSFGDGRYTVRLAFDSNSAFDAISDAVENVQSYARKVDLPVWDVVSVEATEWSEFERQLDTPTFPRVIGVSELSSLLGVSKQRASELARATRFPRPFAELASGPVWLEPTVRRFVGEWERRPGRPRGTSPDPVSAG